MAVKKPCMISDSYGRKKKSELKQKLDMFTDKYINGAGSGGANLIFRSDVNIMLNR